MPNILDKRFIYTPAAETDLSKSFARIRREQKKLAESERKASEAQQREDDAVIAERDAKVIPLAGK